MTRGTITPLAGGGYSIDAAVWAEPKAAPYPDGHLEAGRIVRVTFTFIVGDAGTRAEIEEVVSDSLNEQFDTIGEPILEDLGLRTDRQNLLEQALNCVSPRSAQ